MPNSLEARFLLDALAFIPYQYFDGGHRTQREPTSSQQMLISALEANQWIIGDIRAADLPSGTYSNRFTAWRQGDPYPNCNRTKWKYDAYDYHETSLVRPDWDLAEFIALQHPGDLRHNETDSSIVI